MFALNCLARQATRQVKRPILMQIRSKAKFKDGGEHATLNDMPIPQGSWEEDHKRRNNFHTMILVSGIAAVAGAVLFVYSSGKMVLNCTVPDYPYEEEEEKSS